LSLITGAPDSGNHARESLRLVIDSGVAREFRATVLARRVSAHTVRRLADGLVRHEGRIAALRISVERRLYWLRRAPRTLRCARLRSSAERE